MARADRVWPVDLPRGASGLAGPRPAPVDRGGGGWSTGPPWTGEGRAAGRDGGAMAAPVSSSQRLCGAREAVPRARTRRVRRGGCSAKAGRTEERPGRVGFAAGRLGDDENSGDFKARASGLHERGLVAARVLGTRAGGDRVLFIGGRDLGETRPARKPRRSGGGLSRPNRAGGWGEDG